MDYRKAFVIEAGARVRLARIDPSYTGKHETHEKAIPEIQKHVARMAKLQYLLHADGNQSMLVVLQALDAGGKDGAVRHLFSGMNPQGTSVVCFKQPSKLEAAHDFLWRAIGARRARGRSWSSTGRTTRMCLWCACTSSCPSRYGRGGTS